MATLSQANGARDRYADELAKSGAHAIGVEKGDGFGKPGWVVVAYVEPGAAFQRTGVLKTEVKGKSADVPLIVERADRFLPE